MRFNRGAFVELLQAFRRFYVVKSGPGKRGRPIKLVAKHAILGLLLQFYSDKVDGDTLALLHGAPPSTLSRLLGKAEIALYEALKTIPDAACRWPTHQQQLLWAEWTHAKEPDAGGGIWGFVDGKSYRIQKPSNNEIQNANYNGWKHLHIVTGAFCFGADGTIAWGKTNLPGSWNDGETSRELCERLCAPGMMAPNACIIGDAAFPVSGELFNKIRTPLKEGDLNGVQDGLQITALQQRSNAIVSLRQGAEWGMGAVEKVFRRLLHKLPFDAEVRRKRLTNIYKLYNFRVRRTGISQIRTVLAADQ